MIGFNNLGKLGQLGNQMFQYASLRGIAKNNNYNFCIPYHNDVLIDALGNRLRIELFDCFVMSNVSQFNIQFIDENRPTVTPSTFSFDEKLFNECPDWVNLNGFFQSEKYFKNIETEIRNDFTFKPEIYNPCRAKMSEVNSPVALHIRRGDFIRNSQNHTNLSLDYYDYCLKQFDDDRIVIIFSDDVNWCSEQKLFESERFLISEEGNSYVDLCLMTLCTDFIIANSTFSWWGAWLSRSVNKVIYSPVPEKWFGPNNSHLDVKDLIPENWNIVNIV